MWQLIEAKKVNHRKLDIENQSLRIWVMWQLIEAFIFETIEKHATNDLICVDVATQRM